MHFGNLPLQNLIIKYLGLKSREYARILASGYGQDPKNTSRGRSYKGGKSVLAGF